MIRKTATVVLVLGFLGSVVGCGPAAIAALWPRPSDPPPEIFSSPPQVDVRIPNPADSQTDPGRAWPHLPIAIRVFNPNLDLIPPITVDLTLSYSVNGAPSREPTLLTDAELSIANIPSQQYRVLTVVWNCAIDEGLGLTLHNERQGDLAVANIVVQASIRPQPGIRGSSNTGSASTILNTSPFVAFREQLIDGADRIWSSGDGSGGGTRDIFASGRDRSACNNSAQEVVLSIDQQFAPRQTLPQPNRYTLCQAPLPADVTNGLSEMIPTDVVPGVADCVAWGADRLFSITWTSPQPSVVLIGALPAGGDTRGSRPFYFELARAGQLPTPIALFYAFSRNEAGTSPARIAIVVRVLRHRQGAWQRLPDQNLTLEFPGSEMPSNPQLVAGNFDPDPDSIELVFGGATSTTGLLKSVSFAVDGGGELVVSAPRDLPNPDMAPQQGTRASWLLDEWRDEENARPALLLCRAFGSGPQVSDFHILRQQANGDFAESSWTQFAPNLPTTTRLFQAWTQDLDAGVAGGNRGSDLLLTYNKSEAVPGSLENKLTLDCWLLAQPRGQSAVWRRVLTNVATPNDTSGHPGRVETTRLIDVNGDRNLDLLVREHLRVPGNLNSLQLPYWRYFSSSFDAVAGSVSDVPSTAGGAAFGCRRPALLDADRDGRLDVIAGGRLHKGNTLGGFDLQANVMLPGARSTSYRVEAVLSPDQLSSRAGEHDILDFDTEGGTLASLTTLVLQENQPRIRTQFPITLPPAPIRTILPWRATKDAAPAKDLAILTLQAGGGQLWRARFDGTRFVTDPEPVVADLLDEIATIRLEALLPGETGTMNGRHQAIVARSSADPRTLRVIRVSETGAAVNEALPVPEDALAIDTANIDDDRLEDLAVFTRDATPDPDTLRVRCFVQTNPTATGGFQAGDNIELLRFEPTSGVGSVLQAMRFDRARPTLAEGIVLLGDATASNGEARYILPSGRGTTLTARMVRSPLTLATPLGNGIELVTADEFANGQVSAIIGATDGGGIRRIDRGFRR